ncbi:FAS1-like dehydratase domain-containing protein [Stakelama tenebrarum]|uniref:Acyl dehydratase n=1 Tax=Stakelama tenebrarum TaxID=2711215 RepID=A0A6G6Y7P0_9SPHN|nr:MaoC family dehydratase N-terminal domain-containing protein [Sphingosinithalassobacter tenebrarum]QIG80728.1 acyl dehydratase [Sphingosinithalassobacter tenebrarum]
MTDTATQPEADTPATLDTSDVDKYVGERVVFAEMWDPATSTEIRRWVQSLDYANPLHFDEEFARASKFGGIVAPQSFTVAMDYGHGCHPSCIGNVPGTHLIFAGEEWWFYGDHIKPGDHLRQERFFAGYTVKDTPFAGPTMFADGDTYHYKEDGTLFAKERATSIRYLREEAKKRAVYDKDKKAVKEWTAEEIEAVNKERLAWIMSNREGKSPKFSEVQVGDKLTRRVIGPHTKVSFALEYRGHRQNIWGTWRWNPPEGYVDPAKKDAGFSEDMTYDFEAQKYDPRQKDGLFHGPSSGHINSVKSEKIGMGGAYGYGASMNAWHLDSVAFWAGMDGYIWHSKTQFRSPAREGDVTYVDGEVVEKIEKSEYGDGVPVVVVETRMTTQDGETILKGTAEVQLPL